MTYELAYKMGQDYARNGATTTNCNFAIFSRREFKDAWENGRDSLLPTDSPSSHE